MWGSRETCERKLREAREAALSAEQTARELQGKYDRVLSDLRIANTELAYLRGLRDATPERIELGNEVLLLRKPQVSVEGGEVVVRHADGVIVAPAYALGPRAGKKE